MEQDRWYLALLVVRSSVAGEPCEPLSDVQFRLIRAADSEAAYERAFLLGDAASHEYDNADGETVTWTFSGLRDLREIEDLELVDGTEIYSQIDRSDEPLVTAKDDLTVFWVAANASRPVRELLEG